LGNLKTLKFFPPGIKFPKFTPAKLKKLERKISQPRWPQIEKRFLGKTLGLLPFSRLNFNGNKPIPTPLNWKGKPIGRHPDQTLVDPFGPGN